MSRDKNSYLRLAGRHADYQKLGIDPVEVAQFEDGQRIGTEKGRYEWWHFDAHLDDGATVVVVFSFETERVVADITRYTYRDGDARYVVTFERQETILQAIFTERAPFIKRLIAKIVGFDGAYHRFTGKVTIEKFDKDVRTEIFDDRAIWELMYFGKARSPTP